MKIIFTKLPSEGTIKVSFDSGESFTDYNVSEVSESGIEFNNNLDLRKIKIKGSANVLSNLEVLSGIRLEPSENSVRISLITDTSESKELPDCITNINIPSGVTRIGGSIFSYYTGLTGVTIPEGVTSIGRSTFNGCTGLTSINIPEGVTSIGDYAFGDCTSLTSLTIPDSVTSIGDYAFSGCTGLKTVNYTGNETQWKDITKGTHWILDNVVINYNYQS